jgi:hypothetical protein
MTDKELETVLLSTPPQVIYYPDGQVSTMAALTKELET